MLIHLLVASLASSTLAFANEMTVLQTLPVGLGLGSTAVSVIVSVPNHAKRTFAFGTGKTHSFDIGHEIISVNCKAGSDTHCRCSMKVKDKVSTETKPCHFDRVKSVRDGEGNCLVAIKSVKGQSFKTSGFCEPNTEDFSHHSLKTIDSADGKMTMLVPKGESVAWASTVATVDQRAISVKCTNNDQCDCSIAFLGSQ